MPNNPLIFIQMYLFDILASLLIPKAELIRILNVMSKCVLCDKSKNRES